MTTLHILVSQHALDCLDVSDLSNPKNLQWFTFSKSDLSDYGYTLVGSANVVECTFLDRNAIQAHAVDALKAEIQSVRAKAENEVNKLTEKMQQLLAITNEI
jgi:hypothetical protein